jgi:hypothetical protein
MKIKTFSLLLLSVGMLMSTAICSCSDDDDNILTGAAQALQIVNSANTYIANATSLGNYTYCIIASDSSQAKAICENIIGETWTGSEQVVTLKDNYGTIKVVPGTEDGVFLTITLNIKNVDALTLKVTTEEYANSENRTN